MGYYLGNAQVCMFTFYPQEGIFNLISSTDAIKLIKTDRLLTAMFRLYDHDLERLKDKVYRSGDTYFVQQWNSDGAGAYELVWVLTKEGLQPRLVGNIW